MNIWERKRERKLSRERDFLKEVEREEIFTKSRSHRREKL